MSASRSRSSASRCAAFASAMPMLAVTTYSLPDDERAEQAPAGLSPRSAPRPDSDASLRRARRTRRRDPRQRETPRRDVRPCRSLAICLQSSETSLRSWSPALCPRVSLTSLNLSRSKEGAQRTKARRSARASASSRRSRRGLVRSPVRCRASPGEICPARGSARLRGPRCLLS